MDARSAQVAIQRAQAIVAEKDTAAQRLKSGYLPEEIAGVRQDARKAEAIADGKRREQSALLIRSASFFGQIEAYGEELPMFSQPAMLIEFGDGVRLEPAA